MKHIPSADSHLVIVDRGEELVGTLTDFAAEHGLTSAWMSGLGGAEGIEIGFYDIAKKEYQWRTFDRPLEILSLTGNLSLVDDRPFWHIHGVFSGADYQSIGGHVKRLTIGLTGEIHITPLTAATTRNYDEVTGLKFINPISD